MNSPEHSGVSIIALGSFNPAIFQPRWLGSLGLIRQEEAESAQITVIQPQVTDFSTEWFQLQVLQDKFQILCEDPRYFEPLRDLVAGIFEKLSHTPIIALGIHQHSHFAIDTGEKWHMLGHLLAPKELWRELIINPGLRQLTIEGKRNESSGRVWITVAPSVKIEFGVYMDVHEEFRATPEEQGGGWIINPLNQEWSGFMSFANRTAERILSLV